MRPSATRSTLRYCGTVIAACLLAAGCGTFSDGSKLHTSAKGSVQLHEVADWSFEASHPAVIDQLTMLKVVKGVLEEGSAGTSKLPASGTKPMRVFSDEDAEFLAPLLAQGLSQAKPEQIVGFTVSSSAGSGTGPTAGTVYVQGGTIHFVVASSGRKKGVSFMPSQAARITKAPSYASAGTSDAVSIAIDYPLLAKSQTVPIMATASASKPVPSVPVNSHGRDEMGGPALIHDESPASVEQLRQLNEAKESEIRILRREIDWMKQELRERSDEINVLKASKVSSQPARKKKTAEAHPTR